MTTVSIKKLTDRKELHCQYQGQTSPQPCFVQLDCTTGLLTAEYQAGIGNAIPCSVHHGHDQRWGIPCLTADAANTLLGEIEDLAQRIVDGYASEWDGSNHIAHFTDDAQEAIDGIDSICQNYGDNGLGETVEVWDAADWFQDDKEELAKEYGITEMTTDERLDEIEREILEKEDGFDTLNDLDDFLIWLRDNIDEYRKVVYRVGIGGTPEDMWKEYDNEAEAEEAALTMARGMAIEQGLDPDTVEHYMDEDISPTVYAGACPDEDDGSHWPVIRKIYR